MARTTLVTLDVSPDAAAVAKKAAEHFAATVKQAVAARGMARVAISGGSTPKRMFAVLSEEPFLSDLPWDKLHLYWVDERCVPPSDPESNYGVTKELLLDKVPLPASQVYRMEGELDPQEASSRYEALIRNTFKLEGAETPVFDLVQLGMGDDGHTASLFPHTEGIDELGRIAFANHVPQKNTWRITLSWPVIIAAREVVFLIEGAAKTEVLARVLTGPKDLETLPSQLIRPANGKLLFLLDTAAAAKLPSPHGGTMEWVG